MADLTLRPTASNLIEIAENGAVIDATDAIALMENGKAEGYGFRIELVANGRRMDNTVENKALELAGLSGFDAARQTCTGYIEF